MGTVNFLQNLPESVVCEIIHINGLFLCYTNPHLYQPPQRLLDINPSIPPSFHPRSLSLAPIIVLSSFPMFPLIVGSLGLGFRAIIKVDLYFLGVLSPKFIKLSSN